MVIVAVALLSAYNALPLSLDIGSSQSLPSVWHQIVAIAGLGIPMAVWFVKRNHPKIRPILSSYLMVLLAQIVSEIIMLQWFARGMSVVIGTIYSAFRVVQLWHSQKYTTSEVKQFYWLRIGLWMLLIIWSINLVQFLLFRWPDMLGIHD
ncbi:MAG: hypothetical protein AAF327_21745 [Cyanobacteria bacterium P01_A01_bin.37]